MAAPRIQTGLADFGHFCPGVPETLHIGAYPRIFTRNGRNLANHKSPANRFY